MIFSLWLFFSVPVVAQIPDEVEIEIPETFEPGSEDELLELLNDNPLNPLGGNLDAAIVPCPSHFDSKKLWSAR